MEKIHVYHVDASDEGQHVMKMFLQKESSIRLIGSAKSLSEAMEDIKKTFPDIVIIDENISSQDIAPHIERMLLQSPFLGVIVTSTEQGLVRLKPLMNVGVRDFLVKPFTPTELASSLCSVADTLQKQKKQVVKNTTRILMRAPQVISVFSAKGGVGKSTVSSFLAAGLSTVFKEDTAVVDLDLQFGDISLLMDVLPKTTITNVAESIEKIDGSKLRSMMTKHNLGMHILPSPLNPEEGDFINENALNRLFELLKQEFTYTVIDCPPAFTDQVIVALEHSDFILFVTSPELVSLKNTKSGLHTLKELGIHSDKIKVVVNRYSEKNHMPLSLIEEVLEVPVYATVTNDYFSVIKSMNQGQPQLVYESNSSIGQDMRRIMEALRHYHTIVERKKKHKWFWPFGRNK